jgi:nitrate/nitrite transporter NarK
MPNSKRDRRIKNLSLAGVAALAGLASVIIILTALFVGMWLDNITGRDSLFTISLLLLSVPVSLFTMLKIVMSLVARIIPQPPPHKEKQAIADHMEEE